MDRYINSDFCVNDPIFIAEGGVNSHFRAPECMAGMFLKTSGSTEKTSAGSNFCRLRSLPVHFLGSFHLTFLKSLSSKWDIFGFTMSFLPKRKLRTTKLMLKDNIRQTQRLEN